MADDMDSGNSVDLIDFVQTADPPNCARTTTWGICAHATNPTDCAPKTLPMVHTTDPTDCVCTTDPADWVHH